MASDISNGPTCAKSIWVAQRSVTAGRTRVTVRSRLAFALCLLLTAAVAAACLSACGGSSTESVSPAAPVSGTPAALATSAAAQELRGMLPYCWTQKLIKERSGGSTKTVGDVVQMRRMLWTYRQVSTDPRLSGRVDTVINIDQRQSDLSAAMWGTSRLRNSGGTWVQRWTGGVAAGGDVHHLHGTFRGTGGYAGLVAHTSGWFTEAGAGFTPDIKIFGAGWIETTDGSRVPPPDMSEGWVSGDWTPVVGIATTVQTDYDGVGAWVWDLQQSDPRVSGRLEGDVEEIGDPRPDGSIDYRAKSTVTNPGGAWESLVSADPMVRGPGPGYEHFMYWTSTGSGAYEGLTYHGFWRFMEPKDIVPGDTFVYTGWIEEAR